MLQCQFHDFCLWAFQVSYEFVQFSAYSDENSSQFVSRCPFRSPYCVVLLNLIVFVMTERHCEEESGSGSPVLASASSCWMMKNFLERVNILGIM